MSWHREFVSTPEGLEADLAELERPDRKAEAAQFDAAVAAATALAPTVSKREPMLVTLSGHTDAEAEGFDARNVSITMSRIEPAAAKRRVEETKAAAEAAESAAAAAATRAEEARAAAERAEEEAGEEVPDSDVAEG